MQQRLDNPLLAGLAVCQDAANPLISGIRRDELMHRHPVLLSASIET